MLKLANHLPGLGHTAAAHAPVGYRLSAVQAGDMRSPVKVERQPLRAVDNVLQHQIVYRGVGVTVLGADIEEIAPGNTIRAIVKNMQAVAAPDQHQLVELMGVFSKDVLRIAIGHRDRLPGPGKKIIPPQN